MRSFSLPWCPIADIIQCRPEMGSEDHMKGFLTGDCGKHEFALSSQLRSWLFLCANSIPSPWLLKPNNGSDHRVRTEDLPFQNRAQAGLRVHRIVQVSRYRGVVFNHDCSQCWQRFGVAADIFWLWFTSMSRLIDGGLHCSMGYPSQNHFRTISLTGRLRVRDSHHCDGSKVEPPAV